MVRTEKPKTVAKPAPPAPPDPPAPLQDANCDALSFTEMLARELEEIQKKREEKDSDSRKAAREKKTTERERESGPFSPQEAVELFPGRERRNKLALDLYISSAAHKKSDQERAATAPAGTTPGTTTGTPPGTAPVAPPAEGNRTVPSASPSAETAIQRAHDENLFGLAFSGGGIRSATFNLGVLQGLAKRKLLSRVDYLSTVSGGGYIGAWLAGWIHRRGMDEVEERLGATFKYQPGNKEPPEIRALREYSNYLTPRKGLLGADTWTAIAIYLRNLILNQLVLILFISAVVLAPRALAALLAGNRELFSLSSLSNPVAFWTWILLALGLCFIPIVSFAKNMRNYSMDPSDRVLARVESASGNELKVEFLLTSEDGKTLNDKALELLKDKPAVEIWNRSIKENRTASRHVKIADFDREKAQIKLSEAVEGIDKDDLVVAVYPGLARPKWIFLTATLPIFIGAMLLACVCYASDAGLTLNAPTWAAMGAIFLTVFWYLVFCVISTSVDPSNPGKVRTWVSWCGVFLGPPIAGACGGLLLYKVVGLLQYWAAGSGGSWRVLGYGTPILILILLLFTVLHIGFLAERFFEPRREWWARLVATLMICCFVWAAAFALAGYGPLLVEWLLLFKKVKWVAALVWVVTTGLGLAGGKGTKEGALESQTWKDVLLSVTPYVFIVGLLLLVSFGWQKGLVNHFVSGSVVIEKNKIIPPDGGKDAQPIWQLDKHGYWYNTERTLKHSVHINDGFSPPYETNWTVPILTLVCLVAAYLLALRVDLNEFSMHYLYRNRLVRCYLGASNRERVPNPFTGFDVNDDIPLADLTTANFYDGPLPIFCAALNLVQGKDLAWQERKAESFSMTPLHSGYDVWFEQLPRPGQWQKRGLQKYGYRPTHQYAYPPCGFWVGTAMAISGAAASPNMGYHSSAALSFLMTVFNVRLGWWVGNTRHPTSWKHPGPLIGLGFLLAELFGQTDDTRKYVYLSDGGHFENLGIYELVKRRCRFILASDAGCDKDFSFGDLASAIRKCRSDMGIEIKLRTDKIVASGTPPYSHWHCAIGEICYSDSDPGLQAMKSTGPYKKLENDENGILIYIKASLTSDEPRDILNYKASYPDFPHQTTANQWFTESQFESYRQLGEHIMEKLLESPKTTPFFGFKIETLEDLLNSANPPIEDVFRAVMTIWESPDPAHGAEANP